jgi:hypothetical protein
MTAVKITERGEKKEEGGSRRKGPDEMMKYMSIGK